MEINEIQIPVPWGIIAAKAWGKSTDPIVLTVHGWGDNANSFDPLIPLLPRCFYYVCIDLPGHGRSSAVETSLILRDIDHIIAYKLVYDYFKCDKLTIMAHSFGGFIAMSFTQFFPKCVSKLIVFDVFYYYPHPPNSQFNRLLQFYNIRIKYLPKESKEGPAYTKEDIMNKMMTGRLTPLSRKAAEILIDRNIESAGNGKYRITIAQNVKQMVRSSLPTDDIVDIMQRFPIKCPHLLLSSTKCGFLKFAFRKVYNVYTKNPNFEFHVVDGTHEFHIENPERISPIISKFLLKHQNKL